MTPQEATRVMELVTWIKDAHERGIVDLTLDPIVGVMMLATMDVLKATLGN